MNIIGTKRVPIGNCPNLPNNLHCFRINEIASTSYLNDFINTINQELPFFVLSRDNIEVHNHRLAEGLTGTSLLDRARSFLQLVTHGNEDDSGELGEFLLYLFARDVLGAQKLISKIQNRETRTIPIHGRDGSFVLKDQAGTIYMLLGEAKTTPDSNDGLREAQKDLNDFWSTNLIEHEVSLASTHIRHELNEDNMDLYESFFITDNPDHQVLNYMNVIFVGYSFDDFTNLVNQRISESDFIQAICSDMQRIFTNQSTRIANCPHTSYYCFIPFESIAVARELFISTNNLYR